MEWDQIRENWPQFKNIIKHEWSQLSDLQLDSIAGSRTLLVAKIQSTYGINRSEAETQLANWQDDQINIDGHFYQSSACSSFEKQ